MTKTFPLLVLLALAFGCPPPAPRTARFSDDVAFEDEGAARHPASETVSRGEAALAGGELDEAIGLFREALEEDGADARALLDLGLALELQNRYADAEAAYRQAIEVDPEFPEALNNLGLLLRDTDRSVDAQPILERAVAARPPFGEAWLNLAMTREELGDASGAEEAYRRAIELRSEDALARTNYGYFLLSQDRLDQAGIELRRALPLAGEDAATLVEIARGLRQARHAEPAITARNRAIAVLGQATPALLAERALAERSLGQNEVAEATLCEALALDADHPAANYFLGGMLAGRGAITEARQHLERARRADPDGPVGERAARALQALH